LLSYTAKGDDNEELEIELSEPSQNDNKATRTLENGDLRTVVKRSSFHAFTMALALSVHSTFEGLALGLEEETSEVANIK